MKNILVTALALVVASCAVPEKKTELATETASVEAPTELGAPAPNVCIYSAAARTTRNCYWNDCGDCGGEVGRGQTWKQVWTQVPWTCNTVTPKGWERTPVNPPYVFPGKFPDPEQKLNSGQKVYIYVSGKTTYRADYYDASTPGSAANINFNRCLVGDGPGDCTEGDDRCPANIDDSGE